MCAARGPRFKPVGVLDPPVRLVVESPALLDRDLVLGQALDLGLLLLRHGSNLGNCALEISHQTWIALWSEGDVSSFCRSTRSPDPSSAARVINLSCRAALTKLLPLDGGDGFCDLSSNLDAHEIHRSKEKETHICTICTKNIYSIC